MSKHVYILIADNGHAKVFKGTLPLTTLEIAYDHDHFEGKMKPSDVYADRPGRQPSGAGGFHSFAGERSTHEDEHFARELCKFLDAEARAGSFDSLLLMAPPRFLGELRKHLTRDCEHKLLDSMALDLAKATTPSILQHLAASHPKLVAQPTG